jgi:hypothetical protein
MGQTADVVHAGSRIRRVMYASDFSRASLAALPHAIDVATASDAELLMLHVLPSSLGHVV